MHATNQSKIDSVRDALLNKVSMGQDPLSVIKSDEMKGLYTQITKFPEEQKKEFGVAVNKLKQEILAFDINRPLYEELPNIDLNAPFSINSAQKTTALLPVEFGSIHPLNIELEKIVDIFLKMGFFVVESPEIDDDWHMFGSLNFPEGHPARDDYDTFMTKQKDTKDKRYLAPAHTSTMQNRILSSNNHLLKANLPIAAVIPGRVFRNEDVDARHDHTFNQIEGLYVGEKISIGNLIDTLTTVLRMYFKKDLKTKTQPFYFPFTEPSLEFAISCVFCEGLGCSICSNSGWIELLGCGMIHPNVLKMAGIDPNTYQGFAWGVGLERLVMLKENIEDVRLFESGRLEFLRQYSIQGSDR